MPEEIIFLDYAVTGKTVELSIVVLRWQGLKHLYELLWLSRHRYANTVSVIWYCVLLGDVGGASQSVNAMT